MTTVPCLPLRNRLRTVALALAVLLAGCGGGGGGPLPPVSCDDGSRKIALRDYFDDWYFWYRLSPRPDPGGPAGLDAYFDALLYGGGDPEFPADRWSYFQSTEETQRFYGEGRTLGYGLFVAGLEVAGRPDQPLYVRYVEPRSPAAVAGIVRGERIVELGGRPVSQIIAADDFSALVPTAPGQTLEVTLAGASGTRQVTLAAAIFDLTPVSGARVVQTAAGRRVGYVGIKDMIGQAVAPLTDAFAQFGAAGVHEIVLDLRYNGGGLVSVGRDVGSLVAGPRAAGRTYTSLLYNDKRAAAHNQRFAFTSPPQALALARVYLLAGARTCSATEQLAMGLAPFVDVVLVGDTSCGKPVGFLPWNDGCGRTYSAVNFESVNDRNQGRWFDGLQPTCAVAEDWQQPLGATTEPLLATALAHADGAACSAPAAGVGKRALAAKPQRRFGLDGERPAMIPR